MNQITKAAILHILASMPTKLQSLSETSRKKSSPKVLIILLETHHHLRNSILGRDKTAKTLPKDEAICESPHPFLSYCRYHSSYSEWLIHVPCGLSDQRLIIEEINFLNTAQQPLLFNLFTFSQGDICDSKAKGFTIRKGGNFDGRAGVMETKMREWSKSHVHLVELAWYQVSWQWNIMTPMMDGVMPFCMGSDMCAPYYRGYTYD